MDHHPGELPAADRNQGGAYLIAQTGPQAVTDITAPLLVDEQPTDLLVDGLAVTLEAAIGRVSAATLLQIDVFQVRFGTQASHNPLELPQAVQELRVTADAGLFRGPPGTRWEDTGVSGTVAVVAGVLAITLDLSMATRQTTANVGVKFGWGRRSGGRRGRKCGREREMGRLGLVVLVQVQVQVVIQVQELILMASHSERDRRKKRKDGRKKKKRKKSGGGKEGKMRALDECPRTSERTWHSSARSAYARPIPIPYFSYWRRNLQPYYTVSQHLHISKPSCLPPLVFRPFSSSHVRA